MSLRYKFVYDCRFLNYPEDVIDVTNQMVISGSLERGVWSLRQGYTTNLSIPKIKDSAPFSSLAYTNVGYTQLVNETWQECPLRNLPYVDVSNISTANNIALFRLEFKDNQDQYRYLTFFYRTTGSLFASVTSTNLQSTDLSVNVANTTYLIGGLSAQFPTARLVKHLLPFQFTYGDKNFISFLAISYNGVSDDSLTINKFGAICIDDFVNGLGNITLKPEHDFPESSTTDGYLNGGDHSSDIIGIPTQPSLSVSSIGLINVYHPSVSGLQGFVNDLFPDIDFPTFESGYDLESVTSNLAKMGETIVDAVTVSINEKLLDYVLDVHIIPVTPTDTSTERIKVGYKTSNVSAPKTNNDYVDFDCGTLKVKECYKSFLDYSTTRAKLYLPFVGYVPINNEYFQDGELSVKYRFNVIDGSFVCFVVSTSSKSQLRNSVIGTYSGNCCVHIPISASSFSNVISGVVGGVSNMVQGATSGNAVQAVGGALQTVSSKPNILMNNGYNATSSFLGLRVPYLIIERAVPCYPTDYDKNNGIPSYVTRKISDCKGFTSCDIKNVNIVNDFVDETDLNEIKEILNDYIII